MREIPINPRDFLLKLWVAFGTFGGIVSLASLFDNVIAWIDFIRDIILAYRSLVDSVWGPLIQLLALDAPRWVHDYLTLCAIAAVAVLWSLHRTSIELNFHEIGSTFSALRKMFFDFSVAQSAFQSFARKAKEQTDLEAPNRELALETIDQMAQPRKPIYWVAFDLLWIAALTFVLALAPYLLPFLMKARDAHDIHRAQHLFGMSRKVLERSSVEAGAKAEIETIFEKQADNFITFELINEIYYKSVIKNQLWYYFAVAVLFSLAVFLNYAITRLSSL